MKLKVKEIAKLNKGANHWLTFLAFLTFFSFGYWLLKGLSLVSNQKIEVIAKCFFFPLFYDRQPHDHIMFMFQPVIVEFQIYLLKYFMPVKHPVFILVSET